MIGSLRKGETVTGKETAKLIHKIKQCLPEKNNGPIRVNGILKIRFEFIFEEAATRRDLFVIPAMAIAIGDFSQYLLLVIMTFAGLDPIGAYIVDIYPTSSEIISENSRTLGFSDFTVLNQTPVLPKLVWTP